MEKSSARLVPERTPPPSASQHQTRTISFRRQYGLKDVYIEISFNK